MKNTYNATFEKLPNLYKKHILNTLQDPTAWNHPTRNGKYTTTEIITFGPGAKCRITFKLLPNGKKVHTVKIKNKITLKEGTERQAVNAVGAFFASKLKEVKK